MALDVATACSAERILPQKMLETGEAMKSVCKEVNKNGQCNNPKILGRML